MRAGPRSQRLPGRQNDGGYLPTAPQRRETTVPSVCASRRATVRVVRRSPRSMRAEHRAVDPGAPGDLTERQICPFAQLTPTHVDADRRGIQHRLEAIGDVGRHGAPDRARDAIGSQDSRQPGRRACAH